MKECLNAGITWIPKGLEQMARGPYAERRLRNKDGYALIYDERGSLRVGLEGPIFNVSRAAESYYEYERRASIVVVENSYGSQSPFLPSQLEPEPEIPGLLRIRLLIFADPES